MANILFCHDNIDFAHTRSELWEGVGNSVAICTSAADSLQTIRGGLSHIDVVIVHKDIGLGKERYDSIDVFNALREYPYVRRGVISGEFPGGKNTAVKDLKADFYFPTELYGLNPWLLKQIQAGFVSKEEENRRGKSVEMPLHTPSTRERSWI